MKKKMLNKMTVARGGNECFVHSNLPKKTRNWTNVQLKATLHATIDDDMKVRVVSHTFGIPPSSIRNHLYGRVQRRKR